MPDGLMEIALILFSARECWCPLCVCVCVCVAGWINVTSLADTFLPSRKWVNQMLISLGREPSELCGLLRDELLVTV